MECPFNTETIEHMGVTVRIEYFYDGDSTPFDDDGHGSVRKSNHRHGVNWSTNGDKKPGERPLNCPDHNEYQFYYDWQQAMKIAKRDGWNATPYDAPNRALRAVHADFDFLRGFLNDEWHYAGIVCTVLDSAGDETNEADSCWGFETLNNYHETAGKSLAESLAESVHESKLNSWRYALREARNRKYWASRDIVTVGATA
jgi:hypothetical protein